VINQPENKDEVFIGARSLEDQVYLVLPTYNLLLEQIELIRYTAKNKEHNKTRKENNNTIGIFGARGTGKTSVLYTLMEEFEKNERINIVLPIIEPDNFGENTKIIGSIIGFLSDSVDKELEKIKEKGNIKELPEYFNNCIYKENNPLKSKRDELIEYHLYTESEYRHLLTHNFDDTATHIKKSSYLLTPDIKFKEKLINLIDKLIETRKRINEREDTPLIFIFIDDIDLKTYKCKELIDSILQYANHPNVVTILSGDYDILKESLTLALISDEHLKNNNLNPKFKINGEDRIVDRKKYLANEYLKKLIPPAWRHNVVNWNITTIPNFTFGKNTLAMILDEFMGDNNFFGYKDEGSNKIIPIKYSYSIFDKTPRGLVNVYYHIHQINKFKKEDNSKQDNNKLFQNVKSLIDTIILSSRELINEQQYFFNNCILWGNSAEITFIDYQQILDYNMVHKNAFDYFVICEILKRVIKDIQYNHNDYIEVKNKVLETLYIDDNIYSLEDISYIHTIVLTIAQNTNVKSALLLLQFLTNSKFEQYFAYDDYNDKNVYEKNRNAFIAICKLVSVDKYLLKNMYLNNYDNTDDDINEVFEFLNNISLFSKEYTKTEKTYSSLLIKIFNEINEEYYELGFNSIEHMLLVNTFLEIDEINNINIEYHTMNIKNKYSKQFQLVKQFNKNENPQNNRQKAKVEKIITSLASDISEMIKEKELDLAIKNNKIFEESKKEFLAVSLDLRDTVYKKVIDSIKKIDFNNLIYIFDDYEETDMVIYENIFDVVEILSENYKVWYGRQEAVKFLTILKQQFYIDLNEFGEMIPLIYELGVYFRKNNASITKDIEFEECKKDMRIKLNNAFEDAKNQIEQELHEIGSSLEEDEKENYRWEND
jgi:hypothetical protein